MEFKVKQFAQLMILCHDVALTYDEISGGNTMIDSYQIAEHPEIAKGKIENFMKLSYDKVIKNPDYQAIYNELFHAINDDIFMQMLRTRNKLLSQGILLK
jgi:hypothetical protein